MRFNILSLNVALNVPKCCIQTKFNVNIEYLRVRIESKNGIRGERNIEINEYWDDTYVRGEKNTKL